MFRHPARLAALALIALLPLAASPSQAGWPHPSATNLVVGLDAAAFRDQATITSDGAGGAYVGYRAGTIVRAQHLGSDASRLFGAAGWTMTTLSAGTSPYCTVVPIPGTNYIATTYQPDANSIWCSVQLPDYSGSTVGLRYSSVTTASSAVAVADGLGGVIVAWVDRRNGGSDIYAQRIMPGTGIQWANNGIPLCAASLEQTAPLIVSDGAGGAIVAWTDARSGNLDVYAQRVNSSGTLLWATNGIAVGSGTGDQWGPALIADGNGGAILAWHDWRGGNAEIYAQRLNATGAAQWTANGLAVTSTAGDQTNPALCSDGYGGAIVTWQDGRGTETDIYAQRLTWSGAASWTANGVAVSSFAGGQTQPLIVADGVGGAVIAWRDPRGGNVDLYAQRLNGAGTLQWNANGLPVSTAAGQVSEVTMATDGAGGAILCWTDLRSAQSEVYAQRIDRWGMLGAEPVLKSVRDVPNDQGSKVKLSWDASPLDTDPLFENTSAYYYYRSAPPNVVAKAGAEATPLSSFDPAKAPGRIGTTVSQGVTYYWEYLGSLTANRLASYSVVATTTGDSVGGSNPRTAFIVEARNSGGTQWWYSNPDSGYSVDNLSPATPSPFTATWAAGSATLHWGTSPDADFATFRLHRGNTPSFVPSAGNLVASVPDTGWVDAAGATSYYKLTAVDVHGNVSPVAFAMPSGVLGVDTDTRAGLWLAPPSPQPARGAATLRLALPRAADASVTVCDAQGRLVRTLLDGGTSAGERTLTWDARDAGGRTVPSGLYFVRLAVRGDDARTLVQRLVLVR